MPWELTGNSGTNFRTNFVGTTDDQILTIRTNGIERLFIQTRDPVVQALGQIMATNIFADHIVGISRLVWPESGVRGETRHPDGFGVHGVAATERGELGGTGYAGYFDGRIEVTGDVQFTGPNTKFRIDHPLTPAEKYLDHTCVESSETKKRLRRG